jgi:hypothetical protein
MFGQSVRQMPKAASNHVTFINLETTTRRHTPDDGGLDASLKSVLSQSAIILSAFLLAVSELLLRNL